jgi:hypothetical protein
LGAVFDRKEEQRKTKISFFLGRRMLYNSYNIKITNNDSSDSADEVDLQQYILLS